VAASEEERRRCPRGAAVRERGGEERSAPLRGDTNEKRGWLKPSPRKTYAPSVFLGARLSRVRLMLAWLRGKNEQPKSN